MTSEIRISNITNLSGTSGSVIAGVTTSVGTGYAKIPSGDNTQRVGIESGSIRYNETAKLLEFYDGETWNFIIPAEESANALGVFAGYNFYDSELQIITISTQGDTEIFGSLKDLDGSYKGSCSSSTRGIFGGSGGFAPAKVNIIEYMTFTSKGNTSDFGDLTEPKGCATACSSSTRGVFGGGINASNTLLNTIEYITIATTGNALDFGDLSNSFILGASCSSGTRGIFGGGDGASLLNNIDYITIASQGTNASDFGDLTQARYSHSACSSSTRGVFGGGYDYGAFITDTIDYITIATTGDATDFGDLSIARFSNASCSSSTRGVFGGGYIDLQYVPFVEKTEYITISTTGNTTDFGKFDIQYGGIVSACSNNHGGLL